MPKFSSPPYRDLPPTPHLKPVDIAAYLSISLTTVHHWIERGELHAARLPHYLIRRDEFARWYHIKFGADLPSQKSNGTKEQLPLFFDK